MAHNNLGIALAEMGQLDEAIAAYRKSIALQPDYAKVYSNLGNALGEQSRYDEAQAACRKAVAMAPEWAEGHNNLAVVLAAAGQMDEAVAAYSQALHLNPRFADAWSNLGNALAEKGAIADGLITSRRAVELEPQSVQSHWNYAVALLRSGDLQLGFQEYEWRWITRPLYPFPKPRFNPPRFAQPHWRGEPIEAQTLFIHAEQGFGDTFQFIRFIPLAALRCGKVILEVQPQLHRLLRDVPGAVRVIGRGDPLPPFDQHCPLLSLPLAFGTVLETIPATVPYIHCDPDLSRQWETRLGPATSRPRVGLCWAGRIDPGNDRHRTMPLAEMAPLAALPVTFHSLQIGEAAAQAMHPPQGMELVDHSHELADFAETAALIAQLDLVITIDTAVAHLAGAMGKPVWVLLRALADWRWLVARSDSPWYASMRLFRQDKPGDWTPAVKRMADVLKSANL